MRRRHSAITAAAAMPRTRPASQATESRRVSPAQSRMQAPVTPATDRDRTASEGPEGRAAAAVPRVARAAAAARAAAERAALERAAAERAAPLAAATAVAAEPPAQARPETSAPEKAAAAAP